MIRKWRVRVFTATWLSYAGFYFCRKTFGIVKGPLKEALGVSTLEIAHLWTAFLVAYMLGQFMTAALGRKFTSRTLLVAGMGLSLLANAGMGGALAASSDPYLLMLVLMIINGFAQSTGWAGNVGIMANWTRRAERGTVMALWATCYQLGSVFAKLFAAFMYGWLGLSWSFGGASLILFAVWGVFLFWGQEQPEDVGLEPLEVEVTEEVPIEEGRDPSALSGNVLRAIIAMGLVYFCFKFLRYAVDSWSTLILEESFGLSTVMAGTLSTAFDWVGFVGVFFAGWVSDRYFGGIRSPVIFAMSAGMLGSAVLLWLFGMSSFWMFACCLGLLGFMLMGPDSLLSGTSAIEVGSRRTAVFAAAIINGLGSIGPIVQEPVIGWLMSNHGTESVFILMVGVALLGTIGTGLLWRGSKRLGVQI